MPNPRNWEEAVIRYIEETLHVTAPVKFISPRGGDGYRDASMHLLKGMHERGWILRVGRLQVIGGVVQLTPHVSRFRMWTSNVPISGCLMMYP